MIRPEEQNIEFFSLPDIVYQKLYASSILRGGH